jgi:hypothetical protein
MSAPANLGIVLRSAKVSQVGCNGGWTSAELLRKHRRLEINDPLLQVVGGYSDHP